MLRPAASNLCLLAAALIVLQGCGEPSEAGDCDQLLGEEKYERVLQICGSPFHRASAMLGLAGFNMLALIESQSAPGDVVGLLGLTPENVSERRLLIAGAADEVRVPQSGNQAFALLVSAYLGLAVTVAEYLDNGAGSATALDNVIADREVENATGLVSNPDAALNFREDSPAGYFQIVANGEPLTVLCNTDPTELFCDGSPSGTTRFFDDGDGSGRLDTGDLPGLAEPAGGNPVLSGVSPVNLVVLITDLALPISVDRQKQASMDNFLGQGEPDAKFTIGVAGYLDLLEQASGSLAFFSGAPGGGGSIIADNIAATRALLDNGGDCLAEDDPAGAALMTLLFDIYKNAVGTVRNPDPELTVFSFRNVATKSQLEAGGVTLPDAVAAEQFVFTAPIGFKFLYPISFPASEFDVSNATPRVDAASSAFQIEFENIPLLAPGASEAGDGEITFLELSCART